MNTARQTSTAAILSLVFGILAWVLLPIIGAIIAVIAGHMARADIRHSNGAIDGDAMAVIGLVLGWLQLVLSVVGFLVLVLFFGGLATLAALTG